MGGITDKGPSAYFDATIRGRVQGVAFRVYTRGAARRLGVTGWVRNQKDGSVRVIAKGGRDELEAFISLLRMGPAQAKVIHVEIDESRDVGAFTGFEIKP